MKKLIITILTLIPFIGSVITFIFLFIQSMDYPIVGILCSIQLIVILIVYNALGDVYRTIERFFYDIKKGLRDD